MYLELEIGPYLLTALGAGVLAMLIERWWHYRSGRR
jgi:hypothetical protein